MKTFGVVLNVSVVPGTRHWFILPIMRERIVRGSRGEE